MQFLMQAIVTGAKMGQEECQYQFRNSRWNCTTSQPSSDLQDIYGDVMRISKFILFFAPNEMILKQQKNEQNPFWSIFFCR